jgi:hypothetical protein
MSKDLKYNIWNMPHKEWIKGLRAIKLDPKKLHSALNRSKELLQFTESLMLANSVGDDFFQNSINKSLELFKVDDEGLAQLIDTSKTKVKSWKMSADLPPEPKRQDYINSLIACALIAIVKLEEDKIKVSPLKFGKVIW